MFNGAGAMRSSGTVLRNADKRSQRGEGHGVLPETAGLIRHRGPGRTARPFRRPLGVQEVDVASVIRRAHHGREDAGNRFPFHYRYR